MGKRGPSAQYAYGITIEAGDYKKVIGEFEKRLTQLDSKLEKTTYAAQAMMKSINGGDKNNTQFKETQTQLNNLIVDMEEMERFKSQLAGGQKLNDMFEGLSETKQQLSQLTAQLDEFGNGIKDIWNVLNNMPKSMSNTFSDVRSVLKNQVNDINKSLSNVSMLSGKERQDEIKRISSMAKDFAQTWTNAMDNGVDMNKVVKSSDICKVLLDAAKSASILGDELKDVKIDVIEALSPAILKGSEVMPTGALAKGMKSINDNAKQTSVKLQATLGIMKQIGEQSENSSRDVKKLADVLSSIQPSKEVANVRSKNKAAVLLDQRIDEFNRLQDEIIGSSDVIRDINLDDILQADTDKAKQLFTAIQDIITLGEKIPDFSKLVGTSIDDLNKSAQIDIIPQDMYNEDEIKAYEATMARLVGEIEQAAESAKKLSTDLNELVQQAGLKDITLQFSVPEGTEAEISKYINKINIFVDKLAMQSDRIKKIPMSLAFNETESNKNNINAKSLTEILQNVKKDIKESRQEIEADTREIKKRLIEAIHVDEKDATNIRTAIEAAFNIEGLSINIDPDYIVSQMQHIFKETVYDVNIRAKNIDVVDGIPVNYIANGANGVQGQTNIVQAPAHVSSQTQQVIIEEQVAQQEMQSADIQSNAADIQKQSSDKQLSSADKQIQAAESQKTSAEKQAQAIDKSMQQSMLLQKAAQEMNQFVKVFSNKYAKAKESEKYFLSKDVLSDKEEKGLQKVQGTIKNLTPIKNELEKIFGKVDLQKISEAAIKDVLTNLMEVRGNGSFKGETLPEDLFGLLSGLGGKYYNKYGTGVADLLQMLSGQGGKNGTIQSLFSAYGLQSISSEKKINRDVNNPQIFDYYTKWGKVADVIERFRYNPTTVPKENVDYLSSVLEELEGVTKNPEFLHNIQSIITQVSNFNNARLDYDKKSLKTMDLEVMSDNEYEQLSYYFDELFKSIGEKSKQSIINAIGKDPSKEILSGQEIDIAKNSLNKLSGQEASSQIANDLINWLDMMMSQNALILSEQELLKVLGGMRGQKGLKVGTSNRKGQVSLWGLSNNILSTLDTDVYFDGNDKPITINRQESPTSKRKSLSMISNLRNKREFDKRTQIYTKDNPRSNVWDQDRLSNDADKNEIEWAQRLASLQQRNSQLAQDYAQASEARADMFKRLDEKEADISRQLEISKKELDKQSNIIESGKFGNSDDVNSAHQAINDSNHKFLKKIELMKNMARGKTVSDNDMSTYGNDISEEFKNLVAKRKELDNSVRSLNKDLSIYSGVEENIRVMTQQADELKLNIKAIENGLEKNQHEVNKNTTAYLQKKKEELRLLEEKIKQTRENNPKIEDTGKITSDLQKKREELSELNERINEIINSQTYNDSDERENLLQALINQYKSDLDKLQRMKDELSYMDDNDIGKQTLTYQIEMLKLNINRIQDEILDVGNGLGYTNNDLAKAINGIDSNITKGSDKKLLEEADKLNSFIEHGELTYDKIIDQSLFPQELRDIIQRRNDLLAKSIQAQDLSEQRISYEKQLDSAENYLNSLPKQDYTQSDIDNISKNIISKINATRTLKQEIDKLLQINNSYVSDSVKADNNSIIQQKLQQLKQQEQELDSLVKQRNAANAPSLVQSLRERINEIDKQLENLMPMTIVDDIDDIDAILSPAIVNYVKKRTEEIAQTLDKSNRLSHYYVDSGIIERQQSAYSNAHSNVSSLTLEQSEIGQLRNDLVDPSAYVKKLQEINQLENEIKELEESKAPVSVIQEKTNYLNQQKQILDALKAASIEQQQKYNDANIKNVQLQVDYNNKISEYYALEKEIQSLEQNDNNSEEIAKKIQRIEQLNNEIRQLYEQIHNKGMLTDGEIIDQTLPEYEKKFQAIQKIIEAQKILKQNEAMQHEYLSRIKDSSTTNDYKLETKDPKLSGVFVRRLSGKPDSISSNLTNRFRSAYYDSEQFKEYAYGKYNQDTKRREGGLASQAKAEIDKLSVTVNEKIASIISNISKDAVQTIVSSKYNDSELQHQTAWRTALNKLWDRIDNILEEKEYEIIQEYNEYIESISKNITLSQDKKDRLIDNANIERDTKIQSLFSGTEYMKVFSQESKKFSKYYTDELIGLLGIDTKNPSSRDFLRAIQAQIEQNVSFDFDGEQTEFGQKINGTLKDAEEYVKTKTAEIYANMDKQIADNVREHMLQIVEDTERQEGELASDVVFRDTLGNRINLSREYRSRNAENQRRVYELGVQNKSQRDYISQLREQGGVTDAEYSNLELALARMQLLIYDGAASDIQNISILIGDAIDVDYKEVDTSSIEQTILDGAQKAVNKTEEIVRQSIEKAVDNVAQNAESTVKPNNIVEEQIPNQKELYKQAVQTVKSAIGSFRGRTDQKKSDFYSSLDRSVLDAANILKDNKQNGTKEGNALLTKMLGLRSAHNAIQAKIEPTIEPGAVDKKVDEDTAKNPATAKVVPEIDPETLLKATNAVLKDKLKATDSVLQDKGNVSHSKTISGINDVKSDYTFDNSIQTAEEFLQTIANMVDAMGKGIKVENVEYGLTTKNGRRLELAKGNYDSVYYNGRYDTIDSMTHSHAYQKGTNNMMLSLGDIDQLESLAFKNALNNYNLIYGKEMMKIDLGSDNTKTAMEIAEEYPILNDVITAMFATVDGKSVAAENTGEMSRLLNGYLKKVIEDAGGSFSVINSNGEDVSSRYHITNDEYSKIGNVISNFRDYYDKNYESITNSSDYTKTIREYIAQEFGREFVDNIISKQSNQSKGGIYTEYSVLFDEYDDILGSYSKKTTETLNSAIEACSQMDIDSLIEQKRKLEEALGITREPEKPKATLTKKQQEALNPDVDSARQKQSIKDFSKTIKWNDDNISDVTSVLGQSSDIVKLYNKEFQDLRNIADEIRQKGEQGLVITDADLDKLDKANNKVKQMQKEMVLAAQKQKLTDEGRLFGEGSDIGKQNSPMSRRDLIEQYAKQYASSKNGIYNFSNYEAVQDKLSFSIVDAQGQVTKSTMQWIDELNSVVLTVDKTYAALDRVSQKIVDIDNVIKQAKDNNFINDNDVSDYNKALEAYNNAVKDVTENKDPQLLDGKIKQLQAAQEALLKAGKEVLDKEKSAYGYNAANKTVGRESDIDTLLKENFGSSADSSQAVQKYKDAIAELKAELQKVNENGSAWSEDSQSKLKMLSDNADKAEKELLGLVDTSKKLNEGKLISDAPMFKGVDSRDAQDAKNAMEAYAKSIDGVQLETIRYDEAQKQVTFSVRTGKNEISDMVVRAGQLDNQFRTLTTSTRYVDTGITKFAKSLKSKFLEVGRYLASFGSIYRLWGEIRQGVQYVRDIDTALTELKKVTDETDETYSRFLKNMGDTASVVGSTTSDLTKSAADWARLGYSIQEAGELAKNTSILMNVSEFDDVNKATDTLISALQAFKKDGTDVGDFSMEIIDKFNEVGNNYAISTSDLADSLTRSSAALVAAGNTLEESIAMTTAANTIIQNPENVGNALKVLSMRIRGVKSELEDAGEETDGVVTNTSKLNDQVMALTASANNGKGISLINDDGSFRSTYEILLDISKIWDKMDSMSQASLLEKIAGKTRGSVVAALLQSPEVLEDAFNSATNAAGSATNELNTYLDSIEGRISIFTNSVQTMWTKWLDSNAIKFVVDLGTSLVNLGEKLNFFGTILTVIGGKFILTKLVIPQIVKALNAMKTSVAQATAEAAGETIATDTNTASKLKNAIQSSGASKAVQEEAIKRTLSVDALGAETVALEANTKAKLANALANSGMDESTIGNIIGNVIGGNANNVGNVGNVVSNIIDDADLDDTGSMWANWINEADDVSDVAGVAADAVDGLGNAAANNAGKLAKLGEVFKKIVNQIKAFSNTTLGAISIYAVFAAAMVAIVEASTVSFEEAKETLNGTTDELNDTRSNIKSLNGELENTEQRIAELQSKGKLSFVESEELKKLHDQNDALQRSIELEEKREKRLQEQQAKDAKAVYDRDLHLQAVNATYHGETDTISNGYVDTIARVSKDQENYNEAKKKYEDLMNSDASAKKIKAAEKEMEKTKEICETSKEYLSQTISDLGETYGDLTWQYGEDLEDWQKQINTILKSVYDAQDQSEIALANANGSASEIANAYNNAFKRVSRQTDFEDELKQIQEEADITSDKLREMLSFDSNGLVDASAGGMSEFIQSLIDCGFISDTSADSLQKVIDASIMLGDCTSDAAIANKKLAKSQKTLQYYKQSKELHDYIKKIKDSDRSLKDLTDEERNYINATTDKLKLLSEEISRYDILGDQINEAKEAFDNFENAKQSDSDSDLLDSTSEMFKSIIDGFQSAELGSDTFRAALQGLVPESVYEDLDTLEEKYDAIWNYVNEDLKSYFTVEYNDDGVISSIETTSQNVENFIQDAKDKGLLSFADGMWKVNETNFSNFAKDMNITESLLVAIGTQMDKMDADWINGDLTSFFDSFGMDTESNIYKTVNAMAALDQQLINSDGTDDEKLKEYTESYKKLQDEMRQNGQNAVKDIETYTELTNNVEECQKAVDDATAKLNNLKNSGGSADQISFATTELDEAIAKLGLAINKKGDLTKPSQIVVECAVESIEEQKKEIEEQLKTIDATIELTTTDKDGNEQINSSIIKQLDDGTYAISVDANIPDESKEKIQEYIDLLNQEVKINSYVETDQDAQEYVDTLQKTYENLAQVIDDLPNPDINTSKAMNNVNSLKTATENLKKALDNLPSEVTTTVTTVNKTVYETETKSSTGSWFSKLFKFYDGNAHFDGAAYANGTLGAKQSGVSLTGELGPELLIRGDEWRTIGENGAEFVNVKKGDIIFNHKQTEELIKNGHINSRGKAYASGTAYDGGTSGTIFNKYANISAYGQSSSSNNSNSTDSLSDAAETIKDAADEFKEVFDWFEVLLNEVDSDLDLMAAKLENAVSLSEKDKIYKQILSANNYKMDELYNGIKLYEDKAASYLKEIPNQYREMAKNGAVKITDFVGEGNEEVVEAIQNYREWAEKVQDLNKQLEETKKIIADTRVEQQQQAKTNYDNEISLISAKNDRIQESIDLLKEEGKQVSPLMYEEMAKNSKKELSKLQSAKTKMQAELDSAVKSGDVKKYSSQWYEMVNAINAVDGEINSCKTDIEGFQNSINDLHWENFDKLMQQINNVSEEAENVRSLISEEDSFNDVGEWTGEGITSLGMLITEMENAQYQSQLYGKEIAQLEKDFKQGKYSQDEYNEKLKELQDKQWGSIKAYESSKKELVSLNKARVQAVKDGMQKEIDAYEKLINKQKESLSAQKDAHDWNKQVADQQKEIAKIQRQIDAMAGDNSAAAVAKRAQLYEELYELQDELAESFYDHDIEMQQKALDDSLEAYKTDKEDKMEALDEYLKEEDQVISDSFDLVKLNADVVGQTIKDISKEYGVDFSDTLVNPWKDGASAIGEYNDSLDASQSTYSDYLKNLKKLSDDIQSQSNKEASDILDDINKNANDMTNASYEPPKPKQDTTKPKSNTSTPKTPTKGSVVTVKSSATNWARDGGNGTRMDSWVPGSSFTVYQVDGNQLLLGRNGGYTGWINLKDLQGYAKGTIGVKNSQLAKIDEQLEELVLHADGNGRLAYLTKGTSVIPGDLTKNLMQWGALNPQSFLDQNRPKIGAPHITSNNVELNLEFGALVHVDNCNNDTIPELQKMVKNEFDTMMKQVNKGLKRYTR